MIYASLKTVLCWYNPLTPFCYLMFAACGGLLANLFLMSIFGQYTSSSIYYFLSFLILSNWFIKFAWWRNLDTDISKSNLSTATGLGSFGEISSLSKLVNENLVFPVSPAVEKETVFENVVPVS